MKRPLLVAALAAAALPATASADIGPYTGSATGLLDRYRHVDNHAPDPDHIVTDSKDVYRGRFTYSFRIDRFGTITGQGTGSYDPATWHLEGVNGSSGPFSCDIAMTTPPFGVRVTGSADDGVMQLRFALEGAHESNEETYCGANYYGFATDDTRLANSLELMQPADGLAIGQAEPAIAPLRKLEELGDDYDRRVNLHEWTFTITAPPRAPDLDPDSSVGTASRPRQAGRDRRFCTLEGSARGDRLTGTPGNDVICAYGGGDRIDGRGGHDLIFGGPGRDRITGGDGLDVLLGNAGRDRFAARDGGRDRVTGGGGRDRARVDRGTDRVRGVEQVS